MTKSITRFMEATAMTATATPTMPASEVAGRTETPVVQVQ
jgi:hypothetical protein